MTNFSCYGCDWPSSGQTAVGGLQSFQNSSLSCKVSEIWKVRLPVKQVRQIIKEIRYLKELSNSDQYSFSSMLKLRFYSYDNFKKD